MRRRLTTLMELIETRKQQLSEIACEEDRSLVSSDVLQKSQELDELINEFLKLKAIEIHTTCEEGSEMLQISLTHHNGNPDTVTINISGNLDISTVAILNETIENINGVNLVKIDFTNLEFIDSTGIGALLDTIYRARNNEIIVEFCELKDYIQEIFETVGITRVLEVVHRG
jgi:anti-anti-sigma factor